MPEFIPGLQLSGRFYQEVVCPILDREFPGLVHSAALIHSGSEVLGFDTPQSRDHNWGPRVDLYLREDDYARLAPAITEMLRHRLPHQFLGYPTNFTAVPDEPGTGWLDENQSGPVNHRIFVYTVRGFLKDYLAWDGSAELTPADWLTFPEQKLRTLTQGQVYHDGLGELTPLREKLAYYPHEVWLYLLLAAWRRIEQEEAFVGRCGDVGDDLGSRVLAARLVRDLMRLGFLMERQYAPYPKWFGSGFARLRCASKLTPIFQRVLSAEEWHEREMYLSQAYTIVAEVHNELAITTPLSTQVSSFHSRPYQVIHGERFAEAIRAQIKDPQVLAIASRTYIGSLDHFSDSTDLRDNVELRARLKTLYAAD